MADKKGSYYNNGSYNVYRACIRYETTATTDTSVTIRCRSWCQMGEGHDSSSNIQGRAYITDTYSSWVAGDGTYLNAGDESNFLGDITKTIQKSEQAQTITCSGQVWGSTWGVNSPWVNATVTVPALQSWDVTYNANGGSGAPSAQKKYYGKALTLSSATPTRSGYTFQGWATSSGGSVAYRAGASYTGNTTLNLYAVWRANAVAPTISKLVAYRSTNGTRDESSTTQVTIECTWSMDSGAANRSVVFKYTDDGGNEVTKTVSSPAVSGSTTQPCTVTLAGTSRMTVTATVTDSTHSLSATRTVTIGPVFKPFHMANRGYAAAFFGIADAAWNKILCVFGSFIAEDGNIHADSTNTDSSASSISTQVDRGFYSRDKNKRTIACFYGRQSTDGKDQAVITARRYNSSANVDNSLILAVDKNGNRTVAVTDRKAWQKAIWGWNQIATTTGTTQKSFPDVQASGYTEVLVVGTYTTNASYGGSVLIPVAQLSSTSRDWYLGGGYWSGGWGACCKMTLTSITPYKVRYDGTDGNGTWTVYAR